jgi:hypothetical protein
MARLFSDLTDGTGRQYYFGLNSAPGGISPLPALISFAGNVPGFFIQEQVFRTPAPALITLNGLTFFSGSNLTPAPATITVSGQIPGEYREKIITPALPTPNYSGQIQTTIPTILFINTITPSPALITLQSLPLNATPGGNIAFISPASATLTLQGLTPNAIFFQVPAGRIDFVGLEPTLVTTGTIIPDTGLIATFDGLMPSLSLPFTWTDVDPPPTVTWTTTTGVAA